MRSPWVENYVGTWHDDEGRTLVIATLDDDMPSFDLLVNGTLMLRPWCSDEPALGLVARYSQIDGPDLKIDLGRLGFVLHVNYEFAEPPHEPESLSVAVSSYESDTEGDGFSKLFGRLGRYRRENKEQHLHRVRKK